MFDVLPHMLTGERSVPRVVDMLLPFRPPWTNEQDLFFQQGFELWKQELSTQVVRVRPLTIDHYLLPAYAPYLTEASISVYSNSQISHSIQMMGW
jgi:hypothetical protein